MSEVQAKVNFSGRRPIRHEDVRLEIDPDEHAIRVTGAVDVSALDLPDEARVIVELYREIYSERHEVRLADLTQLDLRFSPHPAPSTLLCNIRVISADTPGLILAAAERVRPDASTELGGRSLLPIDFRDLGPQLWELNLDDDQPILIVNTQLMDPGAVARDPRFQILVFPVALRQVCRWLARQLAAGDVDEGPAAMWRDFIRDLDVEPVATEETPSETDPSWIEDAADRFMARISAVTKWNELTEGGEGV